LVRSLTVFEGKKRFIEAGFPVNKYRLARSEEEAVNFAKEIGFPVVLKIVAPKILHKTDVEGIILNLQDEKEVSQAFNKLMKIMEKHDPSAMETKKAGIMIEEMVENGTETIIGGFTDKSYGKVIIFGLGGIFVEILQDVSFRLAPVEDEDAWEMVKGIKGSKILLDLLRMLAFQVGSEVSLSELGKQLAIDNKTVARYLDLFEKSFIIFNLRGFSRNLRSEVTRKSKYYFFDNGIRNAIISNFNDLELRNDIGML